MSKYTSGTLKASRTVKPDNIVGYDWVVDEGENTLEIDAL